jgi:hypothetical protein
MIIRQNEDDEDDFLWNGSLRFLHLYSFDAAMDVAVSSLLFSLLFFESS